MSAAPAHQTDPTLAPPPPDPAPDLPAPTFIDLGLMSYHDAYEAQRRAHETVVAARSTTRARTEAVMPSLGSAGVVLHVQHSPPVITISRRPDARKHLLASPELLARHGVEIAETDRGGDITYHGPGQLVVYPILDLNLLGWSLHRYMRELEQVVIDVCAGFGAPAGRMDGCTGVWVGEGIGRGAGPARKICALGVRVRKWVTMHGLALNVTTNLDHFGLIVPCGIAGRGVTSLQNELGASCPTIHEVTRAMTERLSAAVTQRREHTTKGDQR